MSGQLAAADRATLLKVARDAIAHGLQHQRAPDIDPRDYSPALREHGAAFVTLEIDDELRGCIGTLEAHRPLVVDVARNAFAAAFRDPRFPPLTAREAPRLALHISVLSAPVLLPVRDAADLLAQLRPGIDGLVLSEGARRATFLPSVWEQLPEPREFLAHLLRKGGWPAGYWSPQMRVERYGSETF